MLQEPARLDRRRFVAGALALPAAGVMPPRCGWFAGGGDTIRVGVVGCGGRGTGAALHAVAAAPGVVITALADAFADQVASSARLLADRAGRGFACPPERRFVGLDAWRRVLESDVDLVVLATPPAFRPLQAEAAVRAGKHVWCETPAAVDAAGVGRVVAACAAAAARGLSFASGLGERHDPVTTALVERVRGGAAGRPLAVTLWADLGPPWCRPASPGWSAAELELRNWIAAPRLSGGDLVERHVAAIDKGLWALGDVDPQTVTADRRSGRVRYQFADGSHLDAILRRRAGATGRVCQKVRCTAGMLDILRPAQAPNGASHPLQAAMRAFVTAIRAGRRLDDGPWLCRASLAAIAGRLAAEAGATVAWRDLPAGATRPARPLQSAWS